MKKIKIGIIGCGYIGGVHAGVLAGDERVQLTAVYDLLPECAERLARAHKARSVIDCGYRNRQTRFLRKAVRHKHLRRERSFREGEERGWRVSGGPQSPLRSRVCCVETNDLRNAYAALSARQDESR